MEGEQSMNDKLLAEDRPTPVRYAGLFRCCINTAESNRSPEMQREGNVLRCRHHPYHSDHVMVWRDGAYEAQ